MDILKSEDHDIGELEEVSLQPDLCVCIGPTKNEHKRVINA